MEFKKMIAEMKNYKMNFISGVIYNLIILAGLFGLLTWNGGLVFSEWFFFIFFYLLVSLISEIVYQLEVEIRTDHLINLISSKTSLFIIYLKRGFIWFLNYSLYFGIISLIFHQRIDFSGTLEGNLLLFLILAISFMVLLISIFFSLTLIFERTVTFVSFCSSILLIFGFRMPFIKDLFDYLNSGILYKGKIF